MRYTPMRCTPMRYTFVRCTSVRCTPVICTPAYVRCMSTRYTPPWVHIWELHVWVLEIFGGAEWRVCRGTEGQMSKARKLHCYDGLALFCVAAKTTNFIWLGIIEYIVSYPNYVSSIVPPWKVLYRDRQPFQSRSTTLRAEFRPKAALRFT
jgi:hypothetical protein